MIDATELFERTDKAFTGLRELSEKAFDRNGVTPEWARLHAKGTAMGNAGAIFREKLSNVTDADVHTAVKEACTLLTGLIDAAEADVVSDDTENLEAEFRNAIANGHADGYKVADSYLAQEVKYFRNV